MSFVEDVDKESEALDVDDSMESEALPVPSKLTLDEWVEQLFPWPTPPPRRKITVSASASTSLQKEDVAKATASTQSAAYAALRKPAAPRKLARKLAAARPSAKGWSKKIKSSS